MENIAESGHIEDASDQGIGVPDHDPALVGHGFIGSEQNTETRGRNLPRKPLDASFVPLVVDWISSSR